MTRRGPRSVGTGRSAVLLLLLAVPGCLGPVKGLYPPGKSETATSIYVVNHGWHTGLVIRRADVPRGIWPENNLHPDARYLEVGWGDADFYPADDPSFWVTFKAACLPTASVLQIVGFHEPIDQFFTESDIFEIKLSPAGVEKLCAFISATYARGKDKSVIPLDPSLYGNGRFYRAKGRFFVPRTCNNWTARALRSAGCPITPGYAVTTGNLFYQVKKFGKPVERTRAN